MPKTREIVSDQFWIVWEIEFGIPNKLHREAKQNWCSSSFNTCCRENKTFLITCFDHATPTIFQHI